MSTRDLLQALELFDAGRHDEAVPLLSQLAQRMPAYVTAHVLLARAYEAMDNWEEARAAWLRAHFLMPNSPTIRDGLQRIHRQMTSIDSSASNVLDLDWQLDAFADDEPRSAAQPTSPLVVPQDTTDDAPVTLFEQAVEAAESDLAAREAAADDDTSETAADEPAGLEDVPFEEVEYEEVELEDVDYEDVALRAEPSEDEPATRPDRIEPEEDEETTGAARAALETEEEGWPAEDTFEWEPLEEEQDADEPSGLAYADDMDLDRLIDELETARIVPAPDLEDIPSPDLEDEIDDVVSETLARIYASQGQYAEAARVYEQLAAQQPEKADYFREKAAAMRDEAGGA